MKIKMILLFFSIMFVFCGQAFTWDEDFEFDEPAGTTDAGTIDTEIQNAKKGLCERLNVDHFFPEDDDLIDDLTTGMHRKVSLKFLSAAPSVVDSSGHLYTKKESTDVELYYQDNEGNETQIVQDGSLKLGDPLTIVNANISGNATISNNLSVNNNAYIKGTMTTIGNTNMSGTLSVSGFSFINLVGDAISKSDDTSYLAASDGFVTCFNASNTTTTIILSDSANPPTTEIARGGTVVDNGCSTIIKKGNYWKTTGASNVKWTPIGSQT